MKIKVDKRKVFIYSNGVLNENEYNIDRCFFEFTKEHVGLLNVAVFKKNDEVFKVRIENNSCDIPYDVLKDIGSVELGVYSYLEKGEDLILRYSPTPDTFSVIKGSYTKDSGDPTDPPLSPYLTVNNIIAGKNVKLEKEGNDITISAELEDIDLSDYYKKQEIDAMVDDIDSDLDAIARDIVNLETTKEDKKEEVQIKGWTTIESDTYEELDLRDLINNGKHKFTIIVYVRKSNIRQAIKFELTTSELNKILSKVNKNMVCITRSCVDPTNANKIAMLKQCMEQVYDGDVKRDGVIRLKYAIYKTDGTMLTSFDNFEWCFYAE